MGTLFVFVNEICARTSSLWINTIRIYEANHQERSEQVERKGEIFEKPEVVSAWLGKASKVVM
jgi:hypothetical protein